MASKDRETEIALQKLAYTEKQAEELTRLREFRTAAIALLQRAYDCGHRHGWEPGESTRDAMSAIHSFLETETDV
jgi:hypothetical protein